MIDRVVFISVLMIMSITAAAGPSSNGTVAADTTVIPTGKTQITGRPLAGKVETDKKEVNAPVKTTSVKTKTAATAKKPAVTNVSAAKKTSSSMTANKKATTKETAAKTSSNKTATTKKVVTSTEKATTREAATKTTVSKTVTAKKVVASTKKSPTKTVTTKKTTATSTKAMADNAPVKSNAKSSSKTKPRKIPKGIGIELSQPLAFKYAILLDVPVEKMIDDKLLEVLDHWYGTRYRYGGESRKGIDCSAFTQAFMMSYFDYELPRRAGEQYAQCQHIKKKKLRQGDLVFFKTKGPKGGITHVGVYLVNNKFVHSATSTGVRISDLGDDYYQDHYAGAGRIR